MNKTPTMAEVLEIRDRNGYRSMAQAAREKAAKATAEGRAADASFLARLAAAGERLVGELDATIAARGA